MGLDKVYKHWWNGTYGKLPRRDVFIWHDGNRRWIVEARSGGLDGRSRRQAVHSEREALALAQHWRDLGGDNWRDISPSRDKRVAEPD